MSRRLRSTLAGVLAAAACLAATSCVAQQQRRAALSDLEREARAAARQLSTRVRAGLEKHLLALQQLAHLLRSPRPLSEQEFHDVASAGTRLGVRVESLSTLDSGLRIHWVYPEAAGPSPLGIDPASYPRAHAAMIRALRRGEPILSPPLRLADSGRGFILAVPLLRRDQFLGEVVSTLRSSEFLAPLLLPDESALFEQQVLASSMPLLGEGLDDEAAPGVVPASESFTLAGRDWEVLVQPRLEALAGGRRSSAAAVWVLGWLAAAAAGAFACSASSNRSGADDTVPATTPREPLQPARAPAALPRHERGAALADIIAGIARQLSDPLCSVIGYSQLALSQPLPEEAARRIRTVSSEAERMGRVLENFLTVASRRPLERRPLGLNGVIHKALEARWHRLKLHRIAVKLDLAADLPRTMLDYHQISQLLDALLDYAERALQDGGRGGAIRISTRAEVKHIELRLSENGPAVAPEALSNLFEPFVPASAGRQAGALDLSLCAGIVRSHGGSIHASSGEQGGVEISIDLPLLGQNELEAPEVSPAPTPAGLRVLVVDDAPGVQDLMVDVLSARGYRVDTASDITEAVRKITAERHDLIISELATPRGSCRDLYLAVAAERPELARRIVFTSGEGASGATLEFVRDTGNALLLKPYRIDQIERAIARAAGS